MSNFLIGQTLGNYPQALRGSVEDRLGVNLTTGTAVFTPEQIIRMPAELQRYVPEFDAASSPAQRADARARRMAEDQATEAGAASAAVGEYHATGTPPTGWVVLQNAREISCSAAYKLESGHFLARIEQIDSLKAHGFSLVSAT